LVWGKKQERSGLARGRGAPDLHGPKRAFLKRGSRKRNKTGLGRKKGGGKTTPAA